MERRKIVLVGAGSAMFTRGLVADLGGDLKALGLKIDPGKLTDLTDYPMNAVISLGGCTASFVSPEGLVVTNHHCAYGTIQYNSTEDNNLLQNGFLAADQVLSMVPGLLRDVVLAHGTDQDYLSHPTDDHFVLVTFAQDPDALAADLVERFNEAALTHYSFMDREMGFLTIQRGDETVQVPLMTLTAALVPPKQLTS